jgi:hypothetical protein
MLSQLNVVLPGLNQLPVELQSFLDDQAPRFHLARATRLDALLAADGYLPLLRGDQAMVCSVADHDGDMSVYTRTRRARTVACSTSELIRALQNESSSPSPSRYTSPAV